MTWSIEGLEAEWKAAREETKKAWAAFCMARAELPMYHAFRIIKGTYTLKVAAGKIPRPDFVQKYEDIRKKLIDEAYQLPEFKVYTKCREEEKESHLVWVDAKMRYGGGVKGD